MNSKNIIKIMMGILSCLPLTVNGGDFSVFDLKTTSKSYNSGAGGMYYHKNVCTGKLIFQETKGKVKIVIQDVDSEVKAGPHFPAKQKAKMVKYKPYTAEVIFHPPDVAEVKVVQAKRQETSAETVRIAWHAYSIVRRIIYPFLSFDPTLSNLPTNDKGQLIFTPETPDSVILPQLDKSVSGTAMGGDNSPVMYVMPFAEQALSPKRLVLGWMSSRTTPCRRLTYVLYPNSQFPRITRRISISGASRQSNKHFNAIKWYDEDFWAQGRSNIGSFTFHEIMLTPVKSETSELLPSGKSDSADIGWVANAPLNKEHYLARTYNSYLPLEVSAVVLKNGQRKMIHLGTTPAQEPLQIPDCMWWVIGPKKNKDNPKEINWQAVSREIRYKDIPGVYINNSILPEEMKDVKSLKVLKWGHVTDKGLKQLEEMDELRVLHLNSANITDVGMSHLTAHKNLQELCLLRKTGITEQGLVYLNELDNLHTLYLTGSNVTDKWLARLRGLKHLQVLHLEDTETSKEEIEELKKNIKGLWVQFH